MTTGTAAVTTGRGVPFNQCAATCIAPVSVAGITADSTILKTGRRILACSSSMEDDNIKVAAALEVPCTSNAESP